ncbi:hypothetical protein CRYUN_Cryun10bG0024900 [Craigia yunnanensis]
MTKPNNDIPQDITDQILPCLPVKSLMRFKCVSKSWRSFINSPSFTRNHLERASSQEKILVSLPCGFKSLDLEKPFDDEAALIRLRFPSIELYDRIKILDSCNGLVCLGLGNDARHLFLWNPSTGDSKKLPECNVLQINSNFICNYCGFGYDSSSDDYKLLLKIDRKLVIFSLAKNSWRLHEALWPYYGCHTKGVYSNGALHYKFLFGTIFAFDLKMERFRFGPRRDASMLGRRRKLFGARETLYCITKDRNSMAVEFWLMDKSCSEESLTKVLSFPSFNGFCYFLNHFLCISKGNEFITKNGEDIIRFDTEGRVVEKIRMCNSPSWCEGCACTLHPRDAITYVETLVSPNRGNV